jgi:hypothetical protein
MHRITEANRQVDKFGTGKDGFRDGDQASGVIATRPGAVTFDVQQEELANAVTGAGLTLSVAGGDYTQLREAIKRLAGGLVRGVRTGLFARTSNAVITLSPVSGDKIAIEIDGVLREASSLAWDNTADLDTGSVAANSIYYIYALVTADALDAKMSLTAPSTTGKVGYHPTRTSERFLFAMRTKTGSAVWEEFDENPDGWTMLRTPITYAPGVVEGATYVGTSLTGLPTTARAVRLSVNVEIDDLIVHYAHEALVGSSSATFPGIVRLGGDSNGRQGPGCVFDLPVDSTPVVAWATEDSSGSTTFFLHRLAAIGWRSAP